VIRDFRLPTSDFRLVRYARTLETAIAKPELKKNWTPSEASFRRLLEWLDAGADSGGEAYLDMRRRLSAYFDRRNCQCPDDLADEALNRVSRRLEEEGAITEGSAGRYCYIVAKFVFLEYVRNTKRESTLDLAEDAHDADWSVSGTVGSLEKRLSCLERCLETLSHADRDLILGYYAREGRNADRRRELAASLGLTSNALAIRACRIRDTLERCVRACEAER
jgi:DNA-directed RNA polymerase specialized sigma24 family protein